MISPILRYQLKNELIQGEGYYSHPYYDIYGKLHIGVGRNIEERGLVPTEIDLMLNHDIDWCWSELINRYPWFYTLDENRKVVVLEMYFSLGAKKFMTFKNFITAMDKKLYSLASIEMLDSKWSKDIGDIRAKRLSRAMEIGQFEHN